MQCWNCQATIAEGSERCPQCGAAQTASAAAEPGPSGGVDLGKGGGAAAGGYQAPGAPYPGAPYPGAPVAGEPGHGTPPPHPGGDVGQGYPPAQPYAGEPGQGYPPPYQGNDAAPGYPPSYGDPNQGYPPPQSPKKGLGTGAWVGIGCGVLLLLGILGTFALYRIGKREMDRNPAFNTSITNLGLGNGSRTLDIPDQDRPATVDDTANTTTDTPTIEPSTADDGATYSKGGGDTTGDGDTGTEATGGKGEGTE